MFSCCSWIIVHKYNYSVVSRANADIAQVRARAKQEQAAYQASLRKEQMKVDSLERTLEQKVSSSSSRHVQLYQQAWPYAQHTNLCSRTKRSRSWLKSVMSWSRRWGRVSDCTCTQAPSRSEKNYLMSKTDQFCLPKDWWTSMTRMVWLTFPADFVYRGATGMVSSYWLCIFFDVSVSVFCLKVFNIISLMSVYECVFGKRTLLNYL